MLKTETNTIAMERLIMGAAARMLNRVHHHLSVDFEHGQWWVSCLDCTRQWSVIDAEGAGSVDGFGFEEVSQGDAYCEEKL